jgi:hypothetical protein
LTAGDKRGQDVDGTQFLLDLATYPLEVGLIGCSTRHADGFTGNRAHLAKHGFHCVGVATVHDNTRAIGGQRPGRGRTNAMCTTRDDRDFACKIGVGRDLLEFDGIFSEHCQFHPCAAARRK